MPYQQTYNVVNGKTGKNLVYRDVYGSSLKSLDDLGFKYYVKSDIHPFGTNMLVKILSSFYSSKDNLYCVVKNTINIKYTILAKDLIKVC